MLSSLLLLEHFGDSWIIKTTWKNFLIFTWSSSGSENLKATLVFKRHQKILDWILWIVLFFFYVYFFLSTFTSKNASLSVFRFVKKNSFYRTSKNFLQFQRFSRNLEFLSKKSLPKTALRLLQKFCMFAACRYWNFC